MPSLIGMTLARDHLRLRTFMLYANGQQHLHPDLDVYPRPHPRTGFCPLLVYFILKNLFDSKSAHLPEEPPEEDAPFFRPSFSAEKFISTAFLQAKTKE